MPGINVNVFFVKQAHKSFRKLNCNTFFWYFIAGPDSESTDRDKQNLEEDDEEEEEGENGQEERDNSRGNPHEEQSQRPEEEDQDHKSAFEFIDPEEMEDLPEKSAQLYSQLDGVTEESENGIVKLQDVHEQMRGLYDEISEEFATKLIKVM